VIDALGSTSDSGRLARGIIRFRWWVADARSDCNKNMSLIDGDCALLFVSSTMSFAQAPVKTLKIRLLTLN
jgi:hypothetical protein